MEEKNDRRSEETKSDDNDNGKENKDKKQNKDEYEELLIETKIWLSLFLFFSGFVFGLLAIILESSIYNTLIPLLFLLIASIVFVEIKTSEGKIIALRLRYHLKLTAPLFFFLFGGVIAGMALGFVFQHYWPFWEKPKSELVEAKIVEEKLKPEHFFNDLIHAKNPEKFSFVVFGDTRTEVYLDAKEDVEIKKQIQRRYSDVKENDIIIISHEKDGKVKEFRITSKDLRAKYANGWPVLITIGDKARYTKVGHEKIYEKVASLIKPDKVRSGNSYVDFAIHTGDVVLWSDKHNNVYWERFENLFYKKLNYQLRKRILPVIGNHEYWKDRYAKNFFKVFKHLKPKEDEGGYHYYALRYGNSYLIFLCSGGHCPDGSYSTCWNCAQKGFEGQVAWLKKVLANAANDRAKHIFVTYHKPSFSHSEHGPLIKRYDPSYYLKEFKQIHEDISVTVFNGHNHTTEIYKKDGIAHFVLGGGGATQRFEKKDWPNQPKELYWNNGARKERYNYLKVKVTGKRVKFEMYRLEKNKFVDDKLPCEIQIGALRFKEIRAAA